MKSLLSRISGSLLIPEKTLSYLIRTSPYRYKTYPIDKRSGTGQRIIAQPAREVKALQYWLMRDVLRQFPVHSKAMAYIEHRSIRTNAEIHVQKEYLLKMDFKDFFNSIRSSDFAHFVRAKAPRKFSDQDIEALQRILFWCKRRGEELVLSVGAPSSPMLSNLLLFDFDTAVYDYCKRRQIRYSRYADDLTFSTDRGNALKYIPDIVRRICRELPYPRLEINENKTVHCSRRTSRRVTGLVLTNNGEVSIGRNRKRVMRAAVHRYIQGLLAEEEVSRLSGHLSFVRSVEPGFIVSLERKYGKDVLNSLR